MDRKKSMSFGGAPSFSAAPFNFPSKVAETAQFEKEENSIISRAVCTDVDIDVREVYFLIMHFLSSGPFGRTSKQFLNELLENQLLPRRYHAWFSRNGARSGDGSDDGISFPMDYDKLAERYPHIEKDHLLKLMKQLLLSTALPLDCKIGGNCPNAADVPTFLGTGSFSLLECDKSMESKPAKPMPAYLRWPHMQADQIHGLALREIGGGFNRHHRAPSIRSACYAVAKPSTILQKIENNKKLRGHRNAVYCAIFDRSGRYVITGSDDRLVKIWSMETAFCLASCRGHEGDITDLAVNSNNAAVASASNDFVIRVWRLPDGMPISVLRGHTRAVTAIAFSPGRNAHFQLLSSSDDGTCRIWNARHSVCLRIYVPKPPDNLVGKSSGPSINGPSSSNGPQSNQILCCAYNANGTVFVTGSSDNLARVWCSPKPNTTELEETPVHELDKLAGHENDVNYVQFSGCSVSSKWITFDNSKEENIPKLKNYRFCQDNIVTCSRDGSAIIWVPKSRRLHGKAGQWIRAYHLKVPPPPLPPQPARGGPRHRCLPTPRGVNMIIWSLDNRFVLAAIMDCRICVWNAGDGSLVHSLTGHTESSYVLDVHPFNPRIAMSAGYDGRTIVWDIWEGIPVRTFELGRFKLVDGKFSPDGTSIVLSDDVGQIYLLNTGEGESQKDARYDQFFLGDYRPLSRDSNANVLDLETQLPPYYRNIQDPLCDGSMIPYPEPYQCTYQKRRLGALGMEWKPSSIKFAIGLDFRVGEDYQLLLPLADLERMAEPLPEFIDATFWEPENEVLSNETDSEYHLTEDSSVEGEQGSVGIGSSGASESNTDDEIDFGYIHKDGPRRSRRRKHSFKALVTSSGRHVKKRNLDESDAYTSKSKRFKRSKSGQGVSKTRSSKKKTSRPQRVAARNAQNILRITESSMDEEYDEDSADDSTSTSVSLDLNFESNDFDEKLHSTEEIHSEEENPSLIDLDVTSKLPGPSQPQSEVVNKMSLVWKFSLNKPKDNLLSVDERLRCENQSDLVSSFSLPQETALEDKVDKVSEDLISSSPDANKAELSKYFNSNDCTDKGLMENNNDIDWYAETEKEFGKIPCKDEELQTLEEQNVDLVISKKLASPDAKCGDDELEMNEVGIAPSNSLERKERENATPKRTIKIKFKKMKLSEDNKSSSKLGAVTIVGGMEKGRNDLKVKVQKEGEDTDVGTSSQGFNGNMEEEDEEEDFSEPATDAIRRTRSTKMKGESSALNCSFDMREGARVTRSSRNPGRFSMRETRSTRSQRGRYNNVNNPSSSAQRQSNHTMGKSSWLMLSKQESCRYIPQLGDKVVYLRQGHQEYLKSVNEPWRLGEGNMSAVETCKIEELDYATIPSGDSCCKITLRFTDPYSSVFGEAFKLTLPELVNFPDFVIEKARYDAAVGRNWSCRDRCIVWWRNADGIDGTWYEGRVTCVEPKSDEFPDSPWERYFIRYNQSGDVHQHSPWELYDPDFQWEDPHIDSNSIDKLISSFDKLKRSPSRYEAYPGFEKLNQAAQKLDFSNRFPYPLYPELIHVRLKNNYYRSLEAVRHDVMVMISNANSFFTKRADLSATKRLSDFLTKELDKLH